MGDEVKMPPEPGIYYDMPASIYHEAESMSASGAKKMLLSPQHYRLARDTPNDPTPEMELGTAIHAGVLEPATFAERVVMLPEVNKRTNAGKAMLAEFYALNPGRVVLDQADFDRCRRCVDAVLAHPAARMLLAGARTEVSLFWRDAKYGVPCKARWDIYAHGGVTDLKSTRDASPDGFARTIANLLYHVAGAHYLSAGEHVLNETPRFFANIAVETEQPHAVACYAYPGNAILAGRHLMDKALARYQAALAAGEWPGYPTTIETITLPRWATTFNS